MSRLSALTIGLALAVAGVVTGITIPASASPPTLTVVTHSVSVSGPGLNYDAEAICPVGSQTAGGGFALNPGGNTNYLIEASAPRPGLTGWSVGLDYSGSAPFTLTAYAICFG